MTETEKIALQIIEKHEPISFGDLAKKMFPDNPRHRNPAFVSILIESLLDNNWCVLLKNEEGNTIGITIKGWMQSI